jgi:hypothetical protein
MKTGRKELPAHRGVVFLSAANFQSPQVSAATATNSGQKLSQSFVQDVDVVLGSEIFDKNPRLRLCEIGPLIECPFRVASC